MRDHRSLGVNLDEGGCLSRRPRGRSQGDVLRDRMDQCGPW